MSKLTTPELTSYAGAVGSVAAAMTLTQWGVIAGIVTALLTCAFNFAYLRRRDMREETLADLDRRERELRLAQMGGIGMKHE